MHLVKVRVEELRSYLYVQALELLESEVDDVHQLLEVSLGFAIS